MKYHNNKQKFIYELEKEIIGRTIVISISVKIKKDRSSTLSEFNMIKCNKKTIVMSENIITFYGKQCHLINDKGNVVVVIIDENTINWHMYSNIHGVLRKNKSMCSSHYANIAQIFDSDDIWVNMVIADVKKSVIILDHYDGENGVGIYMNMPIKIMAEKYENNDLNGMTQDCLVSYKIFADGSYEISM